MHKYENQTLTTGVIPEKNDLDFQASLMKSDATLSIDIIKEILLRYNNLEHLYSVKLFEFEHLAKSSIENPCKELEKMANLSKSTVTQLREVKKLIQSKGLYLKGVNLIDTFNYHLSFLNKYKTKGNVNFKNNSNESLIIPSKSLYELDFLMDYLESKKTFIKSLLREEEFSKINTKEDLREIISFYVNIVIKKRAMNEKASSNYNIKSCTDLINYIENNKVNDNKFKSNKFLNKFFNFNNKYVFSSEMPINADFNILKMSYKDGYNEGVFLNINIGFLVFCELEKAPTYKNHIRLKDDLKNGDHFVAINKTSLGSPFLNIDYNNSFIGTYDECVLYIRELLK